ncbi:hypothetical protein [Desulfoluna butyratoxydans]|uniref:Uncharacterized protein n=1 Tax=Desulfoluna butyratoxydans TaxID=231438 RepID=A0A4U8YQ63_9BACT|nr:hypothetical protein [Desulfoluna butyratoxydans]VFQ43862.1 hypothetical protein MSL71_15030 [Desulfoluna butyratoxydans]
MISDVLVEQIASTIPELEVDQTLFSEHVITEKGVSVITTSNTPTKGGTNSEFRTSKLQIMLRGYTAAEGLKLGERLVESAEETNGLFSVSGDALYTIYSTQALGFPILVSDGGYKDISFEVQVNHHRKAI